MEENVMFVNGMKVHYYEQGEGFPLVLVHGVGLTGGEPHLNFQEILASYGFKVFMLDLPGFGGSWLPKPGWSTGDYAKLINDFVEEKGLEEFYLFGHSMGGTIVIRYAATHPEKVKALLLCAPGTFDLFARWMEITFSILYPILLGIVRVLQLFPTFLYNLFKKRRPKNLYQLFFRGEKWFAKFFNDLILREKPVSDLRVLKSPVLVIWGGRDYIPFALFCVNSIGYIPDYNYVLRIIRNVYHSPHHEAPEEVARLICKFVGDLKKK